MVTTLPAPTYVADAFSSLLGSDRGRNVFGKPLIGCDADIIDVLLDGKVAESENFIILNHPAGPMPEAFFLVDKRLICDDQLFGHGIVAARNKEDEGCLNLVASSSIEGDLLAVFWERTSENGYRPMMTSTVRLGTDYDYAAGLTLKD